MSLTEEQEEAMKAKWEALKTEGTPLEQLRAHAMSKGCNGIRSIGRAFKNLDENGDKKLDFYEFKMALDGDGIECDEATAKEVFDEMDISQTGTISFDEFLIALRPALSDSRKALIEQAFGKFDRDGDGVVDVSDLKGLYSADYHPKFISGEWTEEQVFQNWLDNFTAGSGDYEITKEDFLNYYTGVSSSIDDDEYFVFMMQKAWKLAE